MFELVEYVIVTAIQDRLKFYSDNPNHVDYIFRGYDLPRIKNYVGHSFIEEVRQYAISNALTVVPAFQLDKFKKPGLYVWASSSESQLYIGDFGSQGSSVIQEPKSLFQFSASGYDGNVIQVSKAYTITPYLYSSAAIQNNSFVSKLVSVSGDTFNHLLTLEDTIPSGTDMRQWNVMSAPVYRQCVVSASTDRVSAKLSLITSSDISDHKIYKALVKAALKSLRPTFDAYGFQNVTVSVSDTSPAGPDATDLTTLFTIDGTYTESWIEKEFDLPNSYKLELEARSCVPGTEPVTFELK